MAARTAAQRAADARYDAKRAGRRTRSYWGVWYPSEDADGVQVSGEAEQAEAQALARRMTEDLARGYVSPLHDADVLPDGTTKKPHRHVMWSYPSPVTRERAAEDAERWGLVVQAHWPRPGDREAFRVASWQAAARYLCHLDNPDKHQYSMTNVISIGSASYADDALTQTDEDFVCAQIFEMMDEQHLDSFPRVVRAVRADHPEWMSLVLRTYVRAISEYARGLHYEAVQREQARARVDEEERKARREERREDEGCW